MATDIEKKETTGSLPRYRPATDILEREDGFHLFLDMPGVAKEDLLIDLKENELVVGGKVEHPPVEGERMIEVEFGGGEFYRAFTLSDAVDQEKIKASLVNGVLEVFMPKKEKVLPKRIEIKAG